MDENGETLHSWKDIAACLGVTVRSAQRWEKLAGLPVYRQGAGKKARVFAYREELESWRRSFAGIGAVQAPPADSPAGANGGSQPAEAAGPGASEVTAAGRWSRRWLLAAALVASGAGGFALWRSGAVPGARVPDHARIDGDRLTVLDAKDRVCWAKRIPGLSAGRDHPRDVVVIGDSDGDGRPEVLVNVIPADRARGRAWLILHESNGRERWRSALGVAKSFGGRSFDEQYVGRFVRIVTASARRLILAVADHYLWYPSRTVLLDPKDGKVLEEYWHPGSVYECVVHDLDRDGQEEVLLAGLNNPGEGLGHAALAVLALPFSRAPKRSAGPAEEFPPVTGGGELAYVLFPRPDSNDAAGMLPIPAQLRVSQGRRIILQVPTPGGGMVYTLDFGLRVVEHRFSDAFAASHEQLRVQGLLDHTLAAAEQAALGRIARFDWAPDGNDPALHKFWVY